MLGRRTGLIIANTVVGAGLGFVALKVFAVETGPFADSILGQLAFALGLAGMLSFLLDLGFGAAHIKRVSEGRDLGTAVASFAAVKLALAAVFLVLVAAGAWLGLRIGLTDTSPLAIVLVAMFFALLGLRAVFTATFDGLEEFSKSQVTVLAENLTRAPLIVLFAIGFGGAVFGTGPLAAWASQPDNALLFALRHRGADLAAACYAIAALASLVVAYLLFRRGYPVGRPDRALVRDYWTFGRHIFLAVAVGTIYVSLDKVVITVFWEPSNTGRYFAAQRFSDLIGMVPLAVYTVLFPALSGRIARGGTTEVRGAMEAALRHVSLVVVPVVAFTIAMAGPLLSLVLTGQFALAAPTLRLLAVFALLWALLYPYLTLLQARGRPDLSARAAVVATLVNAALNLLLVPRALGPVALPGLAEVGAAIATVCAVAVQFAMMRRAVHRLDGPVPLARHTGKHLVAGVAMGALLLAAQPLAFAAAAPGCTPDACAGGAPGWLIAGLFVMGGLCYLAVLAALREFTRRDLKLYLHILDPAAMARYVAEEVQSRGPGEPRAGPPEGPPEAKPGP